MKIIVDDVLISKESPSALWLKQIGDQTQLNPTPEKSRLAVMYISIADTNWPGRGIALVMVFAKYLAQRTLVVLMGLTALC